MQNENQTRMTNPPKKFLGPLVVGVLLLVVGVIFFKEAWLPMTERSWIGHRFAAMIFASPLMLLLGAVMSFVGIFRLLRRFLYSAPLVSTKQTVRFEKAWRVCLWAVTGATIFPWWWLGILTWLNGGRPGNEGEGLGGFLIASFIGVPSLALAIFNEARLRRNQSQRK